MTSLCLSGGEGIEIISNFNAEFLRKISHISKVTVSKGLVA